MTHEANRVISEQRSIQDELDYLESIIDRTPEQESQIRGLQSEIGYERLCDRCDGSGEIVAEHKINCRTIDVPYEDCPECHGRGVV